MEIKIVKQVENPLLKRKEVVFEIEHPKAATPNKKDAKAKLAALTNSSEKLMVVDDFHTPYGANRIVARAAIYTTEEAMLQAEGKRITAKHQGKKAEKPKEAEAAAQPAAA